jgi:acyl phosphate:glycerol-3-phosphate acyltransferase
MLIVALCLAYAFGCLSPGWWLVRRSTGTDLRTTGSGMTGATNAARVLGNSGFALVLLLDAAKAAAAVWVARLLIPENPWFALAMPSAVVGHIWPAPLRFQGGRGAGPLLGGCVALNPLFVVAAAVPATIAGAITRRRFAATVAAALGGIVAAWWLLPTTPGRVSFALAVAFVVLAHRSYFVRTSHRPVP